MSITFDTIETAAEALVAAIETGDFDTAERKAVAIQTYLTILPDYGISGRNVRYPREKIDALLKQIKDLRYRQGNRRLRTVADHRDRS